MLGKGNKQVYGLLMSKILRIVILKRIVMRKIIASLLKTGERKIFSLIFPLSHFSASFIFSLSHFSGEFSRETQMHR